VKIRYLKKENSDIKFPQVVDWYRYMIKNIILILVG
jgi:hypothetical protein